jgi:hypothetical protein
VRLSEHQSEQTRIFAEAVERSMKIAVPRAIAEHHRLGNPVAIWKNGRVALLHPDGSITETEPSSE